MDCLAKRVGGDLQERPFVWIEISYNPLIGNRWRLQRTPQNIGFEDMKKRGVMVISSQNDPHNHKMTLIKDDE